MLPVRFRRSVCQGWTLCVTLLPFVLPACSKGGAGDPTSCRKLSDPVTMGSTDRPIGRSLYVELKTPSGAFVTVPLEGIGGEYGGTKQMGKCDERGQYTVERVVLVNAKQELVAVANRLPGSASFKIDYSDGRTTSVAGTSVANYYSEYGTAVASGAVTLQTISASSKLAKQGDRVTVSVSLQGDECGLLKSQWWLADSARKQVTTASNVAGGTGTVMIPVPVDLTPQTYVVEGQVTTRSGQVLLVTRQNAAENNYKLFDPKSGLYSLPSLEVAKVEVLANPDADRVAPQAVQMDATPSRVERCQPVNISLKLSDDRALPTSQTVKVWLGPDGSMLTSVELTGGETLYGTYTIPSDAPGGVWYAYPDLIRDAVGNEARSSFAGGKFTLSGNGIAPKAIQAATFIVPANMAMPDGGVTPLPDLGMPSADMGSSLPALLREIKVAPAAITRDGDSVAVSVKWTDVAGILK